MVGQRPTFYYWRIITVLIGINQAIQNDIQVFMQLILLKSQFYTANLQHNRSPHN